MADIDRVEVAWTGLAGLPGVSVFHFIPGNPAPASLVTFFTAIAGVFPLGLSWTIPTSGDTFDDATGTLTGGWTGSGGGTVAASGAAQHASGCGAYVNWATGFIVNGRRLRGRTFLAPIMNSAYDSAGTIVTGNLTTLQNAATALAVGDGMVIWHRPTTPGASNGSSALTISAQVPDQVTSLRSRRR